ncbi:hypothetical protein KIW84_034867 [Lathyrus oleraceus]|uniref:Uncharacterized protein n=1 Tax=Pisum sativum TaxID=3888 RepID=A0A9D5B4X9_PEA|nr:hypothetical protein KIW84_034867 [Pisum sativum]
MWDLSYIALASRTKKSKDDSDSSDEDYSKEEDIWDCISKSKPKKSDMGLSYKKRRKPNEESFVLHEQVNVICIDNDEEGDQEWEKFRDEKFFRVVLMLMLMLMRLEMRIGCMRNKDKFEVDKIVENGGEEVLEECIGNLGANGVAQEKTGSSSSDYEHDICLDEEIGDINKAYRIGQERVVYPYHLLMHETTECVKYCKQAEKDRLSELVFLAKNPDNDEGKNCAVNIEDRVLDQILQHEKLKDVFVECVVQPKERDLVFMLLLM